MKRKRYSTEQIVAAIKQHELGVPVAEIIRKLGITYRPPYQGPGRESGCMKNHRSTYRDVSGVSAS